MKVKTVVNPNKNSEKKPYKRRKRPKEAFWDKLLTAIVPIISGLFAIFFRGRKD